LDGQLAQIVITMPILVGLDGTEKMSKSKGNYIGVTDQPNDMFGKVMSISDEMMENYFTLLTDTPLARIKILVDSSQTHPKEAKVLLAKTVITQFHDEAAGEAAAAHFDKVFKQKELPDEIPEFEFSGTSISVKEALLACKLVGTGGEAKRMVKQGGVRINGKRSDDANGQISPVDGMILQVGKRKFAQIKIVQA
jgi:tyrosyl-tRNA synthetase